MAVVKNLMVRVGADLSGLVSGYKKGGNAAGNFKKQTEKAMRESAASLSGVKKAMAQGKKDAFIVSLTDQIRELKANIKEAEDAGFSWGFENYEITVSNLRDAESQLKRYIETLNTEPDAPKRWVAQLREWQECQGDLGGPAFGDNGQIQTLDTLTQKLSQFTGGLKESVIASHPLGVQLTSAKKALQEMERIGLGVGDDAWDEMYKTVCSLTDKVNQYKASLGSAEVPVDELVQNLRNAVDGAQSLGAKLQIAKSALHQLEGAGLGAGDDAWDEMYLTVFQLSTEVKEYKNTLSGVGDETEEVKQKTSGLGDKVKSLFGWIKNIGKHSKSSTASIEGLVRSIRRIGLVSVGLQLTKAVFGELQSIVTSYISENTTLQAQVTTLISSLGQALAPAINLVTNALSLLMPYVVGVSNAIGSLITNLFGTGWTTVADGANAAAAAIGGASGAQKEFNRTLAGFDEITKLNAENSGGGGGGSSTTTTAVEGRLPPWLTSIADKVKEAIRNDNWSGVGKALADGINLGISAINESDVSIGARVADLINKGVAASVGFIQNLDWSGLGIAIVTNISDLITGINWSSIATGVGSLLGGLADAIYAALEPSANGLADYFTEHTEAMGGDVIAGLLNGIVYGLADIGSWIYDNILVPFVNGFKSVFDIHSPSRHKDITSMGENVTLGILNGMLKPMKEIGSWINENICIPIIDALADGFSGTGLFSTIFGESGTVLSAGGSKTFSSGFLRGGTGGTFGTPTIETRALFTSWGEQLGTKVIDFRARLTSWWDNLRGKSLSFEAILSAWKDDLPNKNISFNARLTSWWDNLKGKSLPFDAILTAWKDELPNKKLDFKAAITPGWSGSAAAALGIATITSQLKLSVPKVKVVWQKTASSTKENASTVQKPVFSVTYFAKGGIMNSAQIFGRAGNRLFVGGEAGREAILPLERNTWWMDKIADRVALRVNGGGQGGDQNITVNLVVDGKIVASTVVRHVNAQARATGKHPFGAYI